MSTFNIAGEGVVPNAHAFGAAVRSKVDEFVLQTRHVNLTIAGEGVVANAHTLSAAVRDQNRFRSKVDNLYHNLTMST